MLRKDNKMPSNGEKHSISYMELKEGMRIKVP